MEIYLLGTNHKTAEISFREKIAIGEENLHNSLKALYSLPDVQEAIILSTCNRTEVYVVSSSSADIFQLIVKFLERNTGISLDGKGQYFYRMKGMQAVHHLFQVAAGLDSMILGEPQILGQVKDACQIATETETVGIIFNRLANHSFAVGKRVRNETAMGTGAVSVAYAAVELAQKIFKNLSKRSVLLIGAGETGELTAKHLREKGIGKLFITNRTHQKAEELAATLNGEAVVFSQMQQLFPEVDIIVGAAAAPNYLIRRHEIEPSLSKRGNRPLFLIDIGVPRDFDPEINRLESVFLHDIDNLKQIVDSNLKKRQQEIPRAEAIIAEEVENFLEWRQGLQITPTIVTLREKFEEIRQQELNKYSNKLDEEELEQLKLVTRGLLNKLLHLPTVNLKKYANGHPEGMVRVDVVRELFELKDEE